MKTKLPKSAKALAEHIAGLTRRISRISLHFSKQPRNFHDGRAKREFQSLIHRRGRAFEGLKQRDPYLYEQTIKHTRTEA